MRRRLFEAVRWLVAAPAAIALALVAGAERRRTVSSRRRGDRPRLVYGPTPIISIKYMSEAMRRRRYDTLTYVYGVAAINRRDDFDMSFHDLLGGSTARLAVRLRTLVGPYTAFARVLRRGDVFHFFFDGGFLRETPLRFLELQLLHLAGKKVVAMPYGGDVAVPSEIASEPFRAALAADYPELVEREPITRRWIRYFSRHADCTVACVVHAETMPRRDLVTTHYYPIDTDEWAPRNGGREDELVTVFHASNHRAMKGTEHLVRACRELQAEGERIELALAEGMPNEEVRRSMRAADIVAEQFVLGYALTAMEAMSLGKPVLSNLDDADYYAPFRAHTGLDACPIVSTPPERLKATLRELAADPDRRAELGRAGRRYVLAYHGYEPVGRMWELVYRRIWHGDDVQLGFWNPAADVPEGAAIASRAEARR